MSGEKTVQKSVGETIRDSSPVTLILELLRQDWLLVVRTLMFTVGVLQLSNLTCGTAIQYMTEDRRFHTKVIFNKLEQAPNPSLCSPICYKEPEDTRNMNYWAYAVCKHKLATEENCQKLKREYDFEFGKKLANSVPELNRNLCVQECLVEKTKPLSAEMKLKLNIIGFFWILVFMVMFCFINCS